MDGLDPREQFIGDVDLAGLEVVRYPNIIFFCGGPLRDSTPPYFSARHFIADYVSANQTKYIVKNAEAIPEWNHYDVYPDLITFEQDIAKVSRLVVLFVESAGSLVELGAFTVLPEMSGKLLAIINEQYQAENSFITLGPGLYLEKRECLRWYRWGTRPSTPGESDSTEEGVLDIEEFKDEAPLIWADIQAQLEKKKRRPDDSDAPARPFLLICDLIYLFKALTFREIRGYLERFNVVLDEGELRQKLFCLEKLDLIVKRRKSGQTFFLPLSETELFLRFPQSSGCYMKSGVFNTAKLTMDVTQFYLREDKLRSRVISQFNKEGSDGA